MRELLRRTVFSASKTLFFAAFVCGILSARQPASAQTYTWGGGSGTWSTASAWSGQTWANNSDALFNTGSGTVALTTAGTATGIAIDAASGTYTLSFNGASSGNTPTFRIGSGGITANQDLVISSTNNGQNFWLPLVNNSTQAWTVASGKTLSVSGGWVGLRIGNTAAGSVSNVNLKKAGAGSLVFGLSPDIYAGSTFEVQGGTVTAPNVTVSGTLTMTGGEFTIGSGTWADPAGAGVYNFDGGRFSGVRRFANNAILNFNSGTLSFSLRNSGNGAFQYITGSSNLNVKSGGAVIEVVAGVETSSTNGFVEDPTSTGGGFRKLGSGTFGLSGSSRFTGPTRAEAGTLGLNNAFAIGLSTLDMNVADSGTVTFSTNQTLGGLTGSRNLGMGTRTLSIGNNNASTTYSGTLSNGALTKVGTGTLTLTGANTYGGVTTLSAGVVNLGSAETAGTSGPLGKPTTNANSIVLAGGTLQYSASNSNDYSARFSTAASQAYNVDTNGQAVTWASSLSSVGGALRKLGSGTLTLSGSNALAGGVTVGLGQLLVNNANALGTGTATVAGGELNIGSYAPSVGGFTITSGSLTGSGKVTAMNGYALQGGAINASLGAGALSVTADSSLNGTSDATVLNLIAGTLTLGSGSRFTSSSIAVSGSAGAALTLGGNETFGSLDGAANIAVGTSTLSVGGLGTSMIYSGNISGLGNLTKLGAGKLTLTGSSSYAGTTTVSTGALAVNGQITSSVAVATGAVLGGSGIIAGNVGGDGLIAPGNSPGILTVNGQLDATASTAFAFELSQAGAPLWNNASNSVNDVLRLTATSPFTTELAGTNVVNVYFDVTSLANGDTFLGGFFVDNPNSTANLLVDGLGSSSFQYFVKGDGQGGYAYNNVNYYTFNQYMAAHAGITGVTQSVVPVASANFSNGTITTGQVTQFIIVPEPQAVALALCGVGAAGYRLLRRRRR